MSDSIKFVAGQDFYLSGNGIAASDTSITLKSFKFPNSGDTILMTDFGDIGYGTLEPGTSRREFISFTGVTQNGDGSATLTGVTRGLDAAAPYTSVAGLKKGHAGNSLFRITNTPQLYDELAAKDNDETITGTWTFSTSAFPKMSDSTTSPVNDAEFVTKKYVDDTAGGTPVSINRIVVEGTAGATVAAGDLVYLDTTDTEWKLVDATNTATLYNVELGIAQGAGTDGNAITGGVLTQGLDSNQAGLATNNLAYATDVAGTIGTAAGTNEKIIGYVLSATQIVFDPDFGPAPTASEKDALAGTSGTPSSTNKYVTNDDTAATPGASKVARFKANSKLDDAGLGLTTAGDLVYSDGTDFQRLGIGTAGQVLQVNGGATAPEWATLGLMQKLSINTTKRSFTNGSAERTLWSATVPANTLSTNNGIAVQVFVDAFNSDSSAVNHIIRLKYGSTTVASVTVNGTSATSDNLRGVIEGFLSASGATNTQKGWIKGVFAENDIHTSGTPTNMAFFHNFGTAAEDSTGALTISVTMQIETGNADIVSELAHAYIVK